VPLTGALVLLSLPFLLVVGFLAFSLPPFINEQDRSFEKVGQVDEQLAVYRTDGGATTDYGIVVRQEQLVLLGVLLVKNIFNQYHLRDVACQKTGPILTIRDPASGQVLTEVLVKRFFYF
jgi:hypothetical protein